MQSILLVNFCSHLAMNVCNNHCVGPVAHYKVLRSLWDKHDIVNSDVRTHRSVRSFYCVDAIHCLHAPDLKKRQVSKENPQK